MSPPAPPHPVGVEGHPEFAEAQRLIAKAGQPVGKIMRVYEAGHPLAELDEGDVPRETIIYLTPGLKPRTALLLQDGGVDVREGWGASDSSENV